MATQNERSTVNTVPALSAETKAMTAILMALAGLSNAAKQRTLAWALARVREEAEEEKAARWDACYAGVPVTADA